MLLQGKRGPSQMFPRERKDPLEQVLIPLILILSRTFGQGSFLSSLCDKQQGVIAVSRFKTYTTLKVAVEVDNTLTGRGER